MNLLFASLVLFPILVSALLLVLPKNIGKPLIVISAIALSALSVYTYLQIDEKILITAPAYLNQIIAYIDIALLLFFGYIAIKQKSKLVGIMSAIQLGGLLYILTIMPHDEVAQFSIDKLSGFMFLLINIISSVIAVYSIKYIDDEECSEFRKKYFLSIIFWFIAVMNLIVSTDNLEYFFLFFELTTLASYLFIAFRKDEISINNAITALWMNQIGGIAILGAIYFIIYNKLGAPTFTTLITDAGSQLILLPIALMCIAALVKGAQMPFSKWLLGAMVAPTPVSALLHSSTMVKIAPFIILRLSPALHGTIVANAILIFAGFVYLTNAIVSLSQNNLKRILAHSTIALLGLMIMMGTIGTEATTIAALMLMFFHGISKCMLFLNAGILEKVFHLKETSDMERLGDTGPFTALIMLLGFTSLLLPPFGLFIGKWFTIESLGELTTNTKLIGIFVLLTVVLGAAMMTLLYFKALGAMLARTGKIDKIKIETTGSIYKSTIYILLAIVFITIIAFPFLLTDYFAPIAEHARVMAIDILYNNGNMQIGKILLPIVPLVISFFLLPISIIVAMSIKFKNVDRVKEYTCGEKGDFSVSSLYLNTDKYTKIFTIISAVLFVSIIVSAFF